MSALAPFPVTVPRIVHTRSADVCNEAIASLLPLGVLGYDQEWKPNRAPGESNPVAVIQVATAQVAIVFEMGPATGENNIGVNNSVDEIVRAPVSAKTRP